MDVQELKQLYKDGIVYTDIAKLFNPAITVKAVTMRINRLIKRGEIERRKTARPYSGGHFSLGHSIDKQSPPRSTEWTHEPNETSKRLIDMKITECHFPLNGGLYCASPVGVRYDGAKSSYCQHHHNMCWNRKKLRPQ